VAGIHVQERNLSRAQLRPLLLKIAPDLTDSQLNNILDIGREIKLNGLVSINTISRETWPWMPGRWRRWERVA
jgi:dihydroorotate dehydrogenase